MSPREQPHPSGDSADLGDRVPSQSSLTSLERSTKGVAFGAVSVRVYERVVGDHPGTLRRRASRARYVLQFTTVVRMKRKPSLDIQNSRFRPLFLQT
jgi:hypothetical protein